MPTTSSATAKPKRQAKWLKDALDGGSQGASWPFIRRRQRSSTARMMTGREATPTRSSTSSGTPSGPEGEGRRGQVLRQLLPGGEQQGGQGDAPGHEAMGTAPPQRQALEDLARMFNPVLRGWINYYGSYYKSALYPTLQHFDRILVRWAVRKYKRLEGASSGGQLHGCGGIARREPELFAHWQLHQSTAGR